MRTIKVPQPSNVERKNLFINNFKGVDYASSPLDVVKNRAVEMLNLHLDDGILHKRNGARQIDDYEGINGVASAWGMRIYHSKNTLYFISNNTEVNQITYDGTEIYNVKNYNDKIYVFTNKGIYSYAYVYNDKDKKCEIKKESSPDSVYIPTIALGGGVNTVGHYLGDLNLLSDDKNLAQEINIDWSIINKENINDHAVTYYEYVILGTNLNMHKVTFGHFIPFPLVGKYTGKNLTFMLTANCKLELADAEETEGSEGEKLPSSQFSPEQYIDGTGIRKGLTKKLKAFFKGKLTLGEPIKDWEEVTDVEGEVTTRTQQITANGVQIITKTEKVKLDVLGYFVQDVEGDCNWILVHKEFFEQKLSDITDKGKLSKYATFEGQIDRTETTIKLCEKIKSANISAVFGSEGNENRLFIAKDNYVFYSDVNNFAYFPEGNVIRCGAEGSSITAMCKISDGTLAVTKEDYSGDKSIYYISYNLQTDTVADIPVTVERFTAKAGATGFGAVNDKCFVNFADDYVFLSDKGLYAIVSKANISTDLRYMRERSRTINPKLLRASLSDACCYVYKNKLFISDGERTYVADARYRYSVDADMDDTFNYEWFVWDIGAKVFFELGDKLAYVSKDGKAYYFDEGFSDSKLIAVAEGELVSGNEIDLSDDCNSATVSENIYEQISVGDIYRNSGQAYEIIKKSSDGSTNSLMLKSLGSCNYGCDDTIEHFTPVVASWISPYFALGGNYYVKTLKAIGVGLEPLIESEVKFAYKTASEMSNNGIATYDAKTDGGTVDFDNFDFGNMTFNVNSFAKNNVWRVHKRGVNYVSFEFSSEANKDCSVNNVMFEYLITKRLRGAR